MKHSYKSGALALGLCAAMLALSLTAAVAQVNDPPATHPFSQSQPIPGRYIVVFKNSVSNPAAEARSVISGQGGQLHHTYSHAIKGFAATLPEAALSGILRNPNVDYVEQDQTVSLNKVLTTETAASWGLDRIDQHDRPLNNQYLYNYTGADVYAFIIDTGIYSDHVDFGGRVLPGTDFVNDGNGTNDCDGHGTHVAGTVGGTTYGVAKGVWLIPVRVLNCQGSGTWSGVIAGIDWVAGRTLLRPAVANMSLGGGASTSVNAAVAGAVADGVTMVVAAGNSNKDACKYSPSGEPTAITVGATTINDVRASWSNYGTCVDIFAPGSSITSAWNTDTDATNTISGTSMASPHVAGVAALAVEASVVNANKRPSPAAVALFLTSNASMDRLSSIGNGSPNRLVYSLASVWPTEPSTRTVAVKSIDWANKQGGNGWQASATVTLVDRGDGTATVANATVHGNFSPGGTASCVTNNTSGCTMSSGRINKNIPSTMFTVTGVSGSYLTYDPSGATQISIPKP